MKVTYYFILQSNRKGDRQLKIPSPGILLNWINFPAKAQALDPLYLQSSLAKLGNSNQWINVVQNAAVFMWNWHSHIAISIHLFHTCFAAHNFTGIWIGTAKKHRKGRIQQALSIPKTSSRDVQKSKTLWGAVRSQMPAEQVFVI